MTEYKDPVQTAYVSISTAEGAGDPTHIREKNITGEARIQELSRTFVSMAKAYGMQDKDIEVAENGDITLNRPPENVLLAAKYLSYTKLSPYIPSL